ncbi:OsmC family protein [Undibacterium sp. LX40W]|uniref:OsmC family protein n=1 Tax=Undibacterium nitidum TaxID=2762298 RepID=A0A923HTJ3_9BURK|nr:MULTISPECIES: OsmC family protein [Undibacterium]MBC3880929.1 OsmC family protein [Undibacterium nitidum]MBC3890338.1 OsmC family protein [Undibacterium sp. LX40W]
MSINLTSTIGALTAQTIHSGKHQIVSDITTAEGGEDLGPSPHDLYDAALASCKALTLMWYANKKGIKISNIDTRIERDDSQERHGVYKLNARLVLSGDFSDEEFQQLSAVAEKCPVHKLMTSVTTEITTQVERAL